MINEQMPARTKIRLSDFEKELLHDPKWILTKNDVIKKAQLLLGCVQENITDYTNAHPKIFPKEVMAISPKISKGENYLGLPWLMLDYPRYFERENIFAIRTLFWWGKFFSSTLHLSGKFKRLYLENIISNYDTLKTNEFYFCISEDQWKHHLEADNYKPVREISVDELKTRSAKNSFIKLVKKIPLSEWNDAIDILSNEFAGITKLLH